MANLRRKIPYGQIELDVPFIGKGEYKRKIGLDLGNSLTIGDDNTANPDNKGKLIVKDVRYDPLEMYSNNF